jgi:hypothetical protein
MKGSFREYSSYTLFINNDLLMAVFQDELFTAGSVGADGHDHARRTRDELWLSAVLNRTCAAMVLGFQPASRAQPCRPWKFSPLKSNYFWSIEMDHFDERRVHATPCNDIKYCKSTNIVLFK